MKQIGIHGIHIFVEVPQGNSFYNYLKQAKTSFLFSLFYKIREQEGRMGPGWEGLIPMGEVGGGEKVEEGEYGANTVYT
jgi:hypothetical protein